MGRRVKRRALRGGSWINHTDNARADNRNRNNPDNRNNNLGFRVLCVSHTSAVLQQLAGWADYGLPGVAKRAEMARGGPARMQALKIWGRGIGRIAC